MSLFSQDEGPYHDATAHILSEVGYATRLPDLDFIDFDDRHFDDALRTDNPTAECFAPAWSELLARYRRDGPDL